MGGGFPFVDFSNFGNLGTQGITNMPTSNSYNPSVPLTQPSTNFFDSVNTVDSSMKQIFKNQEITVYASLTKSFDKTNVSGAFYVSNNVDKLLSNVKMNLSVKKHVNCKVLSTSGTILEPNKSLGIKKVIDELIYFIFLGGDFDQQRT
jgi:hypothetical protein